MVIIVRVPSIKLPVFLAQPRPKGDRHRIQSNHPFILGAKGYILRDNIFL